MKRTALLMRTPMRYDEHVILLRDEGGERGVLKSGGIVKYIYPWRELKEEDILLISRQTAMRLWLTNAHITQLAKVTFL